MLKEFKEFALQGNMIEMAVGIIIGAAFTSIVNSLVDDIINPLLGIITGGIDFSQLFISLDGQKYASLAAAEAAGGNVLKYGSFIGYVIYFIIVAFVIFLVVKAINTMKERAKKEEAQAPTTKTCPYCQSEIAIIATRCPNCTSMLDEIKD